MFSVRNLSSDTNFWINNHYEKLFVKKEVNNYSDEELEIVIEEIVNNNLDSNLNEKELELYRELTGYNDQYSMLVKRYSDLTNLKMEYKNYITKEYIETENIIKASDRRIIVDWIIEMCFKLIQISKISVSINSIILFDLFTLYYRPKKEEYQTIGSIAIYFSSIILYQSIPIDMIYFISTNKDRKIFDDILKKNYILPIYKFNFFFHEDKKYLSIYFSKNYLKYYSYEFSEEVLKSLIKEGDSYNENKYLKTIDDRNFNLIDINIELELISIGSDSNSISSEFDLIPIKSNPISLSEKFNFENLNYLARGSYGTIIVLNDKKVIKKFDTKQFFILEFILLANINHPNLVKLDSYNKDCVILQRCIYSLINYLELDPDLSLNDKDKLIFQIITGVCYLHEINIIHNDLSLNNIMIDNKNNIKIIDLSVSAYYNYGGYDFDFIISNPVFAPEMVRTQSTIKIKSSKSDIWMLIFIFVYIYEKIKEIKFLRKIFDISDEELNKLSELNKKIKENKFEGIRYLENDERNDIISKMFKVNPDERISSKELFEIYSKLL